MTTTVHILSTLIGRGRRPDPGRGHDIAPEPDAVRPAIGVTGQSAAVDRFLSDVTVR